MATEASRAPIPVREQKTAPAIERPKPIVNDVCEALDDVGCLSERLAALLDSNIADLNDCVLDAQDLPKSLHNRVYSIWMIFVLASEKFAEVRDSIDAINDKAHADRRAVAA